MVVKSQPPVVQTVQGAAWLTGIEQNRLIAIKVVRKLMLNVGRDLITPCPWSLKIISSYIGFYCVETPMNLTSPVTAVYYH